MISNPPHSRLNNLTGPHGPREAALSIGDRGAVSDRGDHNLWAAVAIQPLDVGIGSYTEADSRVAPEGRWTSRTQVTAGTRGAEPYHCDAYGDTVGAARRTRGTPAQKGPEARTSGFRMADWDGGPRGRQPRR
ncbi:hypothetical protein GCM10010260_63280 [Streptomyces filipinensis]|uniref:Uncharacterized protein n=1 Tax=Streptomyces filipinensis TaxID=66887 RepID=A0A918IGP7_9ACTN|nr:hypothetical protein GCM10010260_63280 [Streptomyces filipinensis]